MFSQSRFYLACALVSFSFNSLKAAQDTTATTDSATDLVAKLGHAEYRVREQATQQLLRMGPPVIEVLKQELPARTKEARSRIDSILEVLEQRNIQEITQTFLADDNDDNSYGLSGWSAFRDTVGGGRNAKQLFLQALRSQAEIMAQVEQISKLRESRQSTVDLESKLTVHCAIQASRQLQKLHEQGGVDIAAGDVIAMLFAASSLEGPVPFEVSELIRTMSRLNFGNSINRPGFKPYFLKLLGHWIPKSPELMAPEVMQMARQLNLKEVLPISRQHLSNAFDPFTREQAILCLIQFGDQSDAPELLKYASDTTLIHQYSDMTADANPIVEALLAPPGAKTHSVLLTAPAQKLVRVNDLAIAAAMILTKEDPRQVFPEFALETFPVRWRFAIAVLESEQRLRDEAIHTWIAQHADTATNDAKLPIPDQAP